MHALTSLHRGDGTEAEAIILPPGEGLSDERRGIGGQGGWEGRIAPRTSFRPNQVPLD